AHLAIDGLDRGAPEKKVAEGDAVAAEIHECTPAGTVYIPEPRAVRAEMFFALFDEIDFSERGGVSHFLGFQIFWRKEKLFTVHEQDTMLLCGGDHPFA